MEHIAFNKPYLTGREIRYINDAVSHGKVSGNGKYTQLCHQFFQTTYRFPKCLLTTSCTDALEMAAILTDINPGDEVIMPSYTFVSTANAFVLRGARIVFADSTAESPNLDHSSIESLVTPRTKAIVVVHYAGIACDMDDIMAIAAQHNIFVIEDAAQAFGSYYSGKPLGSIGHLATFSFHETKNIHCGEGGMLIVNDERFAKRAEIIWEMGTNRSAFFRGEVSKYGWVDVGSSFLPSEILAAFLFAQLENCDYIQSERMKIWETYHSNLEILEQKGYVKLPFLPSYSTNNAHTFFVVCNSQGDRDGLISYLKKENVSAVFHYLSLHSSPYYKGKHDGRELPWSDWYSERLVRLPVSVGLKPMEVKRVCEGVKAYFVS